METIQTLGKGMAPLCLRAHSSVCRRPAPKVSFNVKDAAAGWRTRACNRVQ
jgi:hypothetical protein